MFLNKFQDRYAITFGEVSILHVGGQEYGNKIKDNGFSVQNLKKLKNKFEDFAELISISDKLPEEYQENNEASILIIRQNDKLISKEYANLLLKEQKTINYDDKYWDNRRQKTLNKRARLNIVFGDENIKNSSDYKQCSIKSFNDLPMLNKFRKDLPELFGKECENLSAEGNHYHHNKSNIGFHGDSERKIVICLSLGRSSKLEYQWRMPNSSEQSFESTNIKINHGDIYIMSEKATGFDWKKRSNIRVVHSATII